MEKEKKKIKINWGKVINISGWVFGIGAAIYAAKQKERADILLGENNNLRDENRGLRKACKVQIHSIGKLSNELDRLKIE